MKKTLLIIIINILCLVLFLTCQVISALLAAPMLTGRAAKTWAGQSGERFAQLEVFFPYSFTFSEESIYQLRDSIDKALVAAAVEDGENRRLYTDAWSAQGSVSVIGERGSATASAIGVGGDFFIFHPLYLRDGNYITAKDFMRDRVVLDEELAWRLFGSVNLAGLEVKIDGKPFVIAGVISRESDFVNSRAYTDGAGLFMSYEALSALMQEQGGTARIVSYEIVMPDLVTNFAYNTLETALSNESIEIVDNTSRFGYANLFDLIGQFGARSMRTGSLSYPYWENATRFAEDWLALLFLLSLLFLLCPLVFSVIYLVKLIRFCGRMIKQGVLLLLKKREDSRYRKYMEKKAQLEAEKAKKELQKLEEETFGKDPSLNTL